MSATNVPSYPRLEAVFCRLLKLRDAASVLSWDTAAMMPDGGAHARGEQTAALQVVLHEAITRPEIAGMLDEAEALADQLDPWQRANLREMRREWVHAAAVPPELVEALSKATSRAEMHWRAARRDDDFDGLLPDLRQVLNLVREVAAAKAAKLGVEPYDALLDEYEPGGRAAAIDPIFDDLAGFLPGFLDAVLKTQARWTVIQPDGPFPVAKQQALARQLMTAVGFDFDHGRLDTSHHPFCGGVPDDVRITSRWDEDDFTTGLMGVLHETGHAMYERGLPSAWRYQPVGRARGMSIHESQSLLVEMQASRGGNFVAWLAPRAAEAFGKSGPAWTPENFQQLYTKVERSLIRVDADEVTYPAHVILRYRLERAMIAGDLALDELPGAWNDGMKQLLGIAPNNDREGCLQDIHWPGGAWGYFPTYTLGAMSAAQIFQAAVAAVPSIPDAIAQGEFAPLMDWLRVNIHAQASLHATPELLTAATGRPLESGPFKDHLRHRYLAR